MKKIYSIILSAILLMAITVTCKKIIDVQVTGVTLNKPSLTLAVGETETLIATVYPDDAANKTVSWTSSNTGVATVSNGKISANDEGIAIISVITNDGNYTATCTVTVTSVIEPELEWVEINGVKWTMCNVDMPGTLAANPEDAGMFYQWNRKTGWSSTDPMINSDGGTTWDASIPEGDSWEKINDPCPKGWRVPTHAELQELVNSGSEWTTLNGVAGRYFGSGEQVVFFPAIAVRDEFGTLHMGESGLYWSSSMYDMGGDHTAGSMHILSWEAHAYGSPRNGGLSVRCVAE